MPTYESIERVADAFQQPVALEQIVAMCQRAFGEKHKIIAIRELEGGGFNNTYRVELVGMQPVILRVAPRSSKLANVGEANKMRVEHLGQGFFAPIASLIPKTLMADFTRQLIDCDYMFQNFMEGEQWGEIYDTFTLDENKSLWRQLGEITHTIHAVEGPAFGPLYSGPQYNTWSQTLIADLAENIRVLEEHAGLDTDDLRIVQEIARTNTAYLDEIDRPRLRHGDLWTINILSNAQQKVPGSAPYSTPMALSGAIPSPTGPSSYCNCTSPPAPKPSGKPMASPNKRRVGASAT